MEVIALARWYYFAPPPDFVCPLVHHRVGAREMCNAPESERHDPWGVGGGAAASAPSPGF
eukprot:4707345-Alexandrium_andersonii.AAC.1